MSSPCARSPLTKTGEGVTEVENTSAAGVTLSVIVPVHNGAGFLDRCLARLAQSTFRDYECIVVDDASTDETRSVAAQHGARLVSLDQRGGPARARNRGAERARGEVLMFVDADVCVHADTLSQVAGHFRDHPAVDALIGSYDDAPTDPGFISQYKNLFHHYTHQVSRREAWTFWAGCGAIRRRLFLEVKGFDESYTRPSVEDIELGYRLRARGARIDLDPSVQVTHLKRWTFWQLLRSDLFDRGVPWFLLMLRHRTMPADLNVTVAHRLSVALVFAMVLLSATILADQPMASPFRVHGSSALLPFATLAAAVLVCLLFFLNYDLYRFFARKRGLIFAAGTVPLHWLYYWYCGLAVGLGLSVYLWDKLTPRRQQAGVAWPRH